MIHDTKLHTMPPAGHAAAADIGDTMCRAVEDLAHASNASGVWSVLRNIALGFGFDRMVVLEDCQDPTLTTTPVVLYDDAAQVGEKDATAWQDVMTALRAVAGAKPFRLSEGAPQVLPSLGVTEALAVPVTRLLEFRGVVLFAARTGEPVEVSPIGRSALHVLAHCAFERMHAIEREPKRKEPGILSPREAECLRWAAAGKTDNEIGAILKISPRTARFHIENAKRKLGVSTRIQAVAEALRLKAIAA